MMGDRHGQERDDDPDVGVRMGNVNTPKTAHMVRSL
jgi:hypothetical protein